MKIKLDQKESPIISTQRLKIYEMTLADSPFILNLVNTPGWIKYIGKRELKDVSAAEEYLRNGFLKVQADYGFGYYVVKDQYGNSIGIAGFLKKEELEYEDFGFAFMPDWHGRGYALEASQAILKYGCRKFRFSVLDAITLTTNIPSQNLLFKLGFKKIKEILNDDHEEILFRLEFSDPEYG